MEQEKIELLDIVQKLQVDLQARHQRNSDLEKLVEQERERYRQEVMGQSHDFNKYFPSQSWLIFGSPYQQANELLRSNLVDYEQRVADLSQEVEIENRCFSFDVGGEAFGSCFFDPRTPRTIRRTPKSCGQCKVNGSGVEILRVPPTDDGATKSQS